MIVQSMPLVIIHRYFDCFIVQLLYFVEYTDIEANDCSIHAACNNTQVFWLFYSVTPIYDKCTDNGANDCSIHAICNNTQVFWLFYSTTPILFYIWKSELVMKQIYLYCREVSLWSILLFFYYFISNMVFFHLIAFYLEFSGIY